MAVQLTLTTETMFGKNDVFGVFSLVHVQADVMCSQMFGAKSALEQLPHDDCGMAVFMSSNSMCVCL